VSPKTVETYRGRIKEKLGLSDSTELLHRAVRYAQDRGLV
jgi:DNA-binding CsgD family transcriptional regulator